MTSPERTLISDLSPERKALAWSIISNADLPIAEDSAIRSAAHDFSEGIGWGLALWLAERRNITVEEAHKFI